MWILVKLMIKFCTNHRQQEVFDRLHHFDTRGQFIFFGILHTAIKVYNFTNNSILNTV